MRTQPPVRPPPEDEQKLGTRSSHEPESKDQDRDQDKEDNASKKSNEIRVNRITPIYANLAFVARLFLAKTPSIVIKALGFAIAKAIQLAMLVRRRFRGLHTILEVGTRDQPFNRHQSQRQHLHTVSEEAIKIAYVNVQLSMLPLDQNHNGYMPPLPDSEVVEYQPFIAQHDQPRNQQPTAAAEGASASRFYRRGSRPGRTAPRGSFGVRQRGDRQYRPRGRNAHGRRGQSGYGRRYNEGYSQEGDGYYEETQDYQYYPKEQYEGGRRRNYGKYENDYGYEYAEEEGQEEEYEPRYDPRGYYQSRRRRPNQRGYWQGGKY